MPAEATIIDAGPLGEELSAVLRDYTEVARRLQQTHETLQREVVRLRSELESKDRELERRRRLSALGELAAGVAHEVRNPLGALQLYSGLLRKECGASSAVNALIDKLEAGIRAIDNVVQDTLSLTPRGCRFNPHTVRALFEQAREFCSGALAKRGVQLALEMYAPEAELCVDADAIQRVLVNLVVNAAEASQPGRVVRLRSEREREGCIEFRVIDEGCGLPDEVLDRMFDPFFTTKSHGTGLGLSIAFRLIESHRGRLSARNRAEGGAEFTIVLPTQASADDALASDEQSNAA